MGSTSPLLSEEEFTRLKKRDDVVFRKVYDNYYGLVLYAAQRCGLQTAEARDIVQDTFLKLHEKASELKKAEGIKSWLVTTARNHAIDILKQQNRRQQKITEQVDINSDLLEIVDTSAQSAWRELQVELVREMIEDLCLKSGDNSFKLFYVEGKSAKEIAHLNNEPISSVTNRISRIRKRFRENFLTHIERLQESVFEKVSSNE